jgi:anti-anti-sigma regulatory factor
MLEFRCHENAGTVVVAPHGVLDLIGYGELRDKLLKAGADEPRAIVVDLDRLTITDSATVALFTWVAEQLDYWPGVPLLVSAPWPEQRALLTRTLVSRFVPVHASVEDAVAAVGAPRLRRVVRHGLPNSLGSGAIARRLVREVCERWRVDWVDAVIIANELVTNTLVHTYCAPSLRLELRHGMLTVAVYDDDPTRPDELDVPGAAALPRWGLRIVERLASTWGSAPTTSGGKVVWAVLRI